MFSQNQGFSGLLKEGYRHYSGNEEAIFRNVEACKQISNMTKTSLGPNGMKKMVINHLDKIFVTSDAATIMKELEVQHPAAKMLVMASKMQEDECGDATNFVITFAGELLQQAESLIKMSLHPSFIISGYTLALNRTVELLSKMSTYKVEDFTNLEQVTIGIKSALNSKLLGYTDHFAKLIAEACIKSLPSNPMNFDVEHIRVAKILGGNVFDSKVIQGLVVTRNSETTIDRVVNPKICVFGSPIDTQAAETKGTVLLKKAEDLLNYSKSEEEHAEKVIKSIADAGVNLIISGGTVSEICLHFIEKYKMMCVRILSKFELRRICKCLGATALVRLGAPTAEELGHADEVFVQEIGSQKVVIFKRETEDCKLSTILLRGSTNNLLDDIERAIDDGVNIYRNLLKDPLFVYGAGQTEAALSLTLEKEASLMKGLDQYAFNKFAKAFEIIPRILSENAGLNSNDIVSKLLSANNKSPAGIDIENGTVVDSKTLGIYDHLNSKIWAIKLASDAAITILRVDQIIVAKPAGGPKPKENKNWDNDE